jgi:predicted sugar kinase
MKKIRDFSSFPVGTVFNPLGRAIKTLETTKQLIHIAYPSRLGAMTLDPSKIADNNNLVFPAGQISFSIGIYRNVEATITTSGSITVSDDTPRAAIVRHAGIIMQKALGFKEGVHLRVIPDHDIRHSGLGSSGSTLVGVMAAINELFDKPISSLELAQYCAHNYGEEIEGDDQNLMPVQSIGGSSLCGLIDGGVMVVAGEAVPIYQGILPEDLKVVLGIPKDYKSLDAEKLIRAEVNNMEGFQQSGDQYADRIAYRLVHEVLPGLTLGNLKPCKDLIFDFRWDMGSIQNCSFVYPKMIEIAESFRDLQDDSRVDIIALSSVGPAFFGLTKNPDYIVSRFEEQGLSTFVTNIHNGRYIVKEYR